MIRQFLSIFLLVVLFAVSACNNPKSQLLNEVEETSKVCPIDVDEGLVIESVSYQEPNMIINMKLDTEIYDMEILRDNLDVILTSVIKYDNKDLKRLCTLCKEAETNIVLNFVGTNGFTVKGTIPYQKM